jgi:hypothetical protein
LEKEKVIWSYFEYLGNKKIFEQETWRSACNALEHDEVAKVPEISSKRVEATVEGTHACPAGDFSTYLNS